MADDRCEESFGSIEGMENPGGDSRSDSHGWSPDQSDRQTAAADFMDSDFFARSYDTAAAAEVLLLNGPRSHSTSEEDQNGVLNESIVSSGLSHLDWSAEGKEQVYLHLVIPGCSLHDISILKNYTYLQRLQLPHNQLEDLSALSNMPYLMELDASNNSIKKLLDFAPPKNLISVNISFNDISEMGDLSDHSNLQYLCLDNNKIAEIRGLSSCKNLNHLSLQHNRILEVKGLDNLPLRYLGLGFNQLRKIENLESLKCLQTIELAGNKIRRLSGLENHDLLEKIDLEENIVIELAEMQHIQGLRALRSLNLLRNAIQELPDYRLNVLLYLPQLTELDRKRVIIEEKVEAVNSFRPSMEYLAARDHMMHVVYSFLQPSRLLDTTLPVPDSPYPMLVLVGPQGMGKRNLALKLVEELPDYFGYAASHTTRFPRADEEIGKDYHYISMDEFETGIKEGRFLQTCSYQGEVYGLSVEAVESVACESLACIVHVELEGALGLKNSYLEPRYVLILPSEAESFHTHLMLEGVYTESQIDSTMERCDLYKTYNRDHPGFFDATIMSGNIVDTYYQLQKLVMEYLGITSPDSALTTRTSTELDDENTDLSLQLELEEAQKGVQRKRGQSAPVLTRTWSRLNKYSSVGQGIPTARMQSSLPPSARGEVEQKSLQNRFSLAREALSNSSSAVYSQYDIQRNSWSVPLTAAMGAATDIRSTSAPTKRNTYDMLEMESLSSGTEDRSESKEDLIWDASPAVARLKLSSADVPRPRYSPLTSRPSDRSVSEPYNFHVAGSLPQNRPGSKRHSILPPIGGQA